MNKVILRLLVIFWITVLAIRLFIPTTVEAWSSSQLIKGGASGWPIKQYYEQRGYYCPTKPRWVPVPSRFWYGLTCAPPAYSPTYPGGQSLPRSYNAPIQPPSIRSR